MLSTVASVSFEVAADAYDRFMGRYSAQLVAQLPSWRCPARPAALDVGCGPGALTAELVARLGAEAVAPSILPLRSSPRPANGTPASTCGRRAPSSCRSTTVLRRRPRPARRPLHGRPSGRARRDAPGHPARRRGRGLRVGPRRRSRAADCSGAPRSTSIRRRTDEADSPARARTPRRAVRRRRAHRRQTRRSRRTSGTTSFDDWWQPYTAGVGPAGAYLASLVPDRREAVRRGCAELLGRPPFTVTGRAWAARGTR